MNVNREYRPMNQVLDLRQFAADPEPLGYKKDQVLLRKGFAKVPTRFYREPFSNLYTEGLVAIHNSNCILWESKQ